MKALLLGCGNRRTRLLDPHSLGPPKDHGLFWQKIGDDLTTLDIDPKCGPDYVADLSSAGWSKTMVDRGARPFDEIHAYEVLEHLAPQGDFASFFAFFYECWLLLRPGGHFCATVPWWQGPWAWGDPGHKRVIQPESLVFLSQQAYLDQVGKTPMTDYRSVWAGDFDTVSACNVENVAFSFILRAIKPSRIHAYPVLSQRTVTGEK